MAKKKVEGWSAGRKKGQVTLIPVPKKVPVPRKVLSEVEKERRNGMQQLHMLHKRIRGGLVNPNDITMHQKMLLVKYFGYSWDSSPVEDDDKELEVIGMAAKKKKAKKK